MVPNPPVPNPVAVPVVLAGVPPNEKPPVLQYENNVKFRNVSILIPVHTGKLHYTDNYKQFGLDEHLLTLICNP